jgi:hypothetical protein
MAGAGRREMASRSTRRFQVGSRARGCGSPRRATPRQLPDYFGQQCTPGGGTSIQLAPQDRVGSRVFSGAEFGKKTSWETARERTRSGAAFSRGISLLRGRGGAHAHPQTRQRGPDRCHQAGHEARPQAQARRPPAARGDRTAQSWRKLSAGRQDLPCASLNRGPPSGGLTTRPSAFQPHGRASPVEVRAQLAKSPIPPPP